MAGTWRTKKKPGEQVEFYARLHRFLKHFARRRILDFDAAAAERFDTLRKKRLRVGTMDLKIAAITLVNNAKLISRNLSDFKKIPELDVEDWTK